MSDPSFLGLVQDFALLLALLLIFDVLVVSDHLTPVRQAAVGFLLGAMGIAIMMTPWVLIPGVVFDARTVLLSISGLFFGAIPTIIAMAITAVFRFYQAGSGALSGVLVIVTSGTMGILWRHFRKQPLENINWRQLYLFGLGTHLLVLPLVFTMPWDSAQRVLANLSLPVLVIFPVGTILLGLFMVNRRRRENNREVLLVDLTERKKTTAQLARLAERFDLATRSAQIGIWDWDIVQNRLDWDDRMYELYGIKKEDFAGAYEAWLNGLHPEDYSSSNELSQQAVRGEKEYDTEFRVVWPDGTVHWLKAYGQVIRDADGTPLRMIGVNYDITGQKTTGVKIRRQADRLKLLADASQAFSATAGDYQALLDQVVRQVCAALADMCQVRLLSAGGELLELAAIYSLDAELSEVLQAIGRPAAEHAGDPGLALHVLRSGEPVFVPVISVEQTRASIPPESWSIYERFAPHSYIVVPLRLEGSSIGVMSLTRYRSEQPAFTEDDLSLAQDLASRAALAIHGALLFKQVQNELAQRRQAEEQVQTAQVELQGMLVEAQHARQALLSVVEDQKEAEGQIRRLTAGLEQRVKDRTAQLEAVNRELEAFSYSVSHDLRAPLRSLKGFSTILMEEYAGKLDEQGLTYLVRIQEASQRMSQLIDDMLSLARITRQDVNLSRVDLSLLAHQVARELQDQSPDRQVEFEISPDLVVRADYNLMKIALQNLLGNALKFTGKRERAHITFGMVDQPGARVYFVRDNGAGFNMTYADKLFTPFQRLHGVTEYPGTGIGLSIVQRIMARHGGRIWPEAAVDQGATFYFTME